MNSSGMRQNREICFHVLRDVISSCHPQKCLKQASSHSAISQNQRIYIAYRYLSFVITLLLRLNINHGQSCTSDQLPETFIHGIRRSHCHFFPSIYYCFALFHCHFSTRNYPAQYQYRLSNWYFHNIPVQARVCHALIIYRGITPYRGKTVYMA